VAVADVQTKAFILVVLNF